MDIFACLSIYVVVWTGHAIAKRLIYESVTLSKYFGQVLSESTIFDIVAEDELWPMVRISAELSVFV